MHADIYGTMVGYFDDGKFVQKIDEDFVPFGDEHDGDNVVYLFESEFDLDEKCDHHAFYDMQVYKTAPNLNCITEVFLASNRYRRPDKIEFLQSMLNSRLGLFEVVKTDVSEGYAYIKEVFTGDEYKIIDIGLSGNPGYDNIYIYTRIISYGDTSFGTGLNLVFTKTDDFIKAHIRDHKEDYHPNGEQIRFIQLFNRFSKDAGRVKIVANTL